MKKPLLIAALALAAGPALAQSQDHAGQKVDFQLQGQTIVAIKPSTAAP